MHLFYLEEKELDDNFSNLLDNMNLIMFIESGDNTLHIFSKIKEVLTSALDSIKKFNKKIAEKRQASLALKALDRDYKTILKQINFAKSHGLTEIEMYDIKEYHEKLFEIDSFFDTTLDTWFNKLNRSNPNEVFIVESNIIVKEFNKKLALYQRELDIIREKKVKVRIEDLHDLISPYNDPYTTLFIKYSEKVEELNNKIDMISAKKDNYMKEAGYIASPKSLIEILQNGTAFIRNNAIWLSIITAYTIKTVASYLMTQHRIEVFLNDPTIIGSDDYKTGMAILNLNPHDFD